MKPKIMPANTAGNKVFIALGTNLGNREKNLQTALTEITTFSRIINKSSIYETEPYGYKKQNDFLNMAIEIETGLSPVELIIRLQEIEHKMGKNREIKNGPRLIDLDILLYNQEIISQPNLKIPHPHMHERNFVLTPLAEISEKTLHPTLKKDIKSLLKNLKNQGWIKKR